MSCFSKDLNLRRKDLLVYPKHSWDTVNQVSKYITYSSLGLMSVKIVLGAVGAVALLGLSPYALLGISAGIISFRIGSWALSKYLYDKENGVLYEEAEGAFSKVLENWNGSSDKKIPKEDCDSISKLPKYNEVFGYAKEKWPKKREKLLKKGLPEENLRCGDCFFDQLPGSSKLELVKALHLELLTQKMRELVVVHRDMLLIGDE